MDKCVTCRGTTEVGACPHCRKRMKKIIKETVAFIDLLNAHPILQQQTFTQQENRGSGTLPAPINVQIVDLISKNGVQAILGSWAEFVVEVRKLSPSALDSTKEYNKLHTYMNVLHNNMDWLAEHRVWLDFYIEVKRYHNQLRAIVYGERKPPKPVPCPVQDCNGTLILSINGDVDCCDNKEHRWEYHEWSRLARLVVQI